ncbi:trypsin-like peptidase domain-containing protein [Nocardia testacea]|uniref:nSTAND1 domain-containing NTPase n=1 Tax=Nocardia testacea TaxID=248551 RepID=UPI003A84559C
MTTGKPDPAFGSGGLLGATAARVFSISGDVAGSGFVIGPGLVATCAHVIAEAVGADPRAPLVSPPPIRLDFPLARPGAQVTAQVRKWLPIDAGGGGDIAVLSVGEGGGGPGTTPPFWRADEPWGREFRVLGFPVEHGDGVWVAGEFRARQGIGWLQLQAAVGGQPITAGFSGAAVWDVGSAAVVGMAVATDRRRYTRTAFMIPIAEVLGLDPTLLPNPYRGAEQFRERDAHLFHGRATDIDRVLTLLGRRSIVAVAGPSGTGKSSLVSAGVIPRLRKRGMSVVTFRLGGQPFGDGAVGSGRASAALGDPLEESVGVGPARRVARFGGISSCSVPDLGVRIPARGLVLFLDQFEDLAGTDPGRARALLRRLIQLTDAAGATSGGSCLVVLTVRGEALHERVDGELAQLLAGATVALAPMGRGQLREVIRGPATHAPGVGIAADLVERLIDDTVAEPGGLSLLETMLSELWERRTGGTLTLADYERAGRVGGSIARRAERALAQFTDGDTAARARRLLAMLAAPAETGPGFVRSAASMADFPELRDIAGALARHRLVVIGRCPDGTETVELAHRALIDHWPLLRRRLEHDRVFRCWQRSLEAERLAWHAARHENARLLRGRALTTAEEWIEVRGADVPPADRRYVQVSRRLRRREERRRRAATTAVAALALVLAKAVLRRPPMR